MGIQAGYRSYQVERRWNRDSPAERETGGGDSFQLAETNVYPGDVLTRFTTRLSQKSKLTVEKSTSGERYPQPYKTSIQVMKADG